ncbi:MAG: hypothetical protein RI907_1257 [Pseudomonadota bacterium]|jgi:uncharacterized membrane protein
MQGPRRKLVHALLYEGIAIVIVTLLMLPFSDGNAASTGALSVVISVIAMLWNMGFNTAFEAWERRQASRERTVGRRAVHALLFEGGLVLLTVPLIAWWLAMSWWAAFVLDLGLMALFLVYTFGFNWAFDHVFGLPEAPPC